MANDAMRVLARAERPLPPLSCPTNELGSADDIEPGLTLLGLVVVQDPPRDEARDAVQRCQRADIRVVMITGDHPDTARAIARELDILAPGDESPLGASWTA